MTRLWMLWRLWVAPHRHVSSPFAYDAEQRAAWLEMVDAASVRRGPYAPTRPRAGARAESDYPQEQQR